jgi:hypothetical protein
MTKVTVTFDVPDPEAVGAALMSIEDALPDDADNLEWDTDE